MGNSNVDKSNSTVTARLSCCPTRPETKAPQRSANYKCFERVEECILVFIDYPGIQQIAIEITLVY